MPHNHRNQQRIHRDHNTQYQRNGTKSYVFLLNKFAFNPTLDGPYTYGGGKSHEEDLHGKVGVRRAAGGASNAHLQRHKLQKKDPSTGQTGDVPAEDVQNDSEYLCQVTIGSQTFSLDFDTGSADLWVSGAILVLLHVTAQM